MSFNNPWGYVRGDVMVGNLYLVFVLVSFSIMSFGVGVSAATESMPIISSGATSCSRLPLRVGFNPNDYNVYQGDLNGDGDKRDILMHRKNKFVLIYSDVLIPIYLTGPSSVKFIRQSDGRYSFDHAEATCDGTVEPEYSEGEIQQLVTNGGFTYVHPSNTSLADFNLDGATDAALNTGESVLVFHWSASTPSLVSSLKLVRNSEIVIHDVNRDGLPDMQIFVDGKFLRVYLADSNGMFSSDLEDDPRDKADDESKIATINQTWKFFTQAMTSGNYEEGSRYLTPYYKTKVDDLISTLGDEVGEVLEQVQSIAPYYVGAGSSTFLVHKIGDDGVHTIHTVTFESSEDGSWKIAEM